MNWDEQWIRHEQVNAAVGTFVAITGIALYIAAGIGGNFVDSGSITAIVGLGLVLVGTCLWLSAAAAHCPQ